MEIPVTQGIAVGQPLQPLEKVVALCPAQMLAAFDATSDDGAMPLQS